MRYTIKDMQEDFPNDDACLEFLFHKRFGNIESCPSCGVIAPKYHRVRNRKSYACQECGHHLYPLAGTIFHKSTTPLNYWFHAIYLFSVSKNGVAALELQRQIPVSYETAHRMEKMIRLLMHEHERLGFLGTPIEVDEAFIGGKRKQNDTRDAKTPIMAALEVGGHVRTAVVARAVSRAAIPFLLKYIEEGARLHTDESKIYKHKQVEATYRHSSVRHIAQEFVKDRVTTNHVEGFFSQLKRSLDGTYHVVSARYLPSYVAEFAFRYNHRREQMFPLLLEAASQLKK